MNFISNLISTPTQEHLHLNQYIIVIISLIFLTYMGILFGSVFLSLVYSNRARSEENPLFQKLAVDLATMFVGNKTLGIIMGVIPSFVLLITFSQVLHNAAITISQYFLYVFLFTSVGIVFAHLFKNSLLKNNESIQKQNGFGGLTLLFLVLMVFTFISSTSLILFPSKWTLVKMQIPVFFDFNIVVRFLIFFAAAFALTGSAIVFFFFNWSGGKQNLDQAYRSYVAKLGGGLALGFTLFLPLLIVWNFKTIPPVAESMTAYWIAAGILVLLLVTANLLYLLLKNSNLSHGSSTFVLLIVAFLFMTVNDNIAREEALTVHTLFLMKEAGELEAQIAMQREEGRGGGEADAALGEQVFNTKCIACHRFDQRLVGPAYNDVLPKYENDIEALVNFILNPVKINPDFPIMPNQALKPQEARAVAQYLMNVYQSENK